MLKRERSTSWKEGIVLKKYIHYLQRRDISLNFFNVIFLQTFDLYVCAPLNNSRGP